MPGGREAPPGRAAMPAGRLLVFVCLAAATLPTAAAAQIAPLPMEPIDGEVVGFARIADGEGGFDPGLFMPAFGQGLAALGDIDGNGVDDLVAGADGPSPTDGGAVWVLRMAADGSVLEEVHITGGVHGFTGPLDIQDFFGDAVAGPGDVDGDGVPDLAVGARLDDDGGFNAGAVWILFLNADGSVKAEQKISRLHGGLADPGTGTQFGRALAPLGDVDGNGVPDLAVGMRTPGLPNQPLGAVVILLLAADGTVVAQHVMSESLGPTAGLLVSGDDFGQGLAAADFDADGVLDLVVSSPGQVLTAVDLPQLWFFTLATDGSPTLRSVVGADHPVLEPTPGVPEGFGKSLLWLPDLDGDGVRELAVGSPGGGLSGWIRVVFLDEEGGLADAKRIGHGMSGFPAVLGAEDALGTSLTWLGAAPNSGTPRLATGSLGDAGSGAVWLLDLGPRTWTDLGFALPGFLGNVPQLQGSGDLSSGSPLSLTVSGGLPNSTAWLVVGFDTAYLPVNGGVLVPSVAPPSLVLTLPTGPTLAGTTLNGTWPTGIPADFQMFLQAWIFDPTTVYDFSATNGLLGHTP